MSTALQEPQTTETVNYLNAEYGWKSWLFTTDHKRIAVLYLISISVMFALGGVFAGLIRTELLTPEGDLFNSDTYNKIFTMHGIVMVFFVLIPAVPAVLGNFVLPMMLGARDLAFPFLNSLGLWLTVAGAILINLFFVVGGDFANTGWLALAPFSELEFNPTVGVDYLIWSLQLFQVFFRKRKLNHSFPQLV